MKHNIPTTEELESNEALVGQTIARFKVEYRESDNQKDLFTLHHVRYASKIYMDGELLIEADYQCNPDACGLPEGKDIIRSVAEDADTYTQYGDMADFLEDFGYCDNAASVRAGMKAYEGCKRAHETISKNGASGSDIRNFLDFCENEGIDIEIETNELD